MCAPWRTEPVRARRNYDELDALNLGTKDHTDRSEVQFGFPPFAFKASAQQPETSRHNVTRSG